MTNNLTVRYNATTFSPTPLVNYSRQPVDFGYVYGYNTDITLDGFYTGITTTGTAIAFLTGAFANQFKALTVTDNNNNTLYSWTGVTVSDISFDTNPYFSGSFLRYSVKLRAYDLPSGVIDPSNEYAFTQNEDSTVNVVHKISARGVRNTAGAFDNAVAFVRQFTGKDPYSNCLPALVPSGSGILLSINETINRADGSYLVSEVYKYNTGALTPYVKTTSLDISDSMDAEYKTIDYTLKLQGSPVQNNVQNVITGYLSYSVLSDIQTEFGFTTTNWVKNSYSSTMDSGSATIDIRIGYLSGANPSGFFDYDVMCEKDFLTNTENWKVDGEFRCFGPLDYKLKQLQSFKSANKGNDWRSYLSGLILTAPIYSGLHNTGKLFSPNFRVTVTENSQLATLRINTTIVDGYEPTGIAELRYSMEVVPSRWLYEIMSSANIEGSYVIQDLQAQSRTRQKFSFEAKTTDRTGAKAILGGYLSNLANTYVQSGDSNNVRAFLTEDNLNTGTYEMSASNSWIGDDLGISSGLLALISIGSSNDIAPLRPVGYNFGY